MAEQRRQIGKIRDDVFAGHSAALRDSTESSKRYLQNFRGRNNSIPVVLMLCKTATDFCVTGG